MAFMWLWDAPQGYRQLRIALCSQPKLAFQGTDAMKWTWNVMPFGPTNSPATFINFANNICSVWQEEARNCGVPIGNQYNTHIIVDDSVNWGKDLGLSLLYMQFQLRVCRAYNLYVLSLSVSTCALMAISQPALSMSFWRHSRILLRFAMLLGSSALDSFTVNSSPILSFVSCPYAVLHLMNTLRRWVSCGHLKQRRHMTTSNQQYWATLVSSVLIIKS